MKRSKTLARRLVPLFVLSLLLSLPVKQALAQFRLRCDAVSALGGTSSAASNKLLAIAGQPHPITTSSSASHILYSGFIPCIQRPSGSSIAVSSPAAGATWTVGTAQTVAWSSSNVTGNVNIKLSTNGGATFPIPLASNTANDGTEAIPVPNNPSPTCRVRVESVLSSSVFDDNPGNFIIQPAGVCPLTWQANLTVRDAGSNSVNLSIGQGPNATNDIDVACGEAELPPVPPTGTFDARLELPVLPPKASLKDYRNDSEQAINWRIKFQPGAVGAMTFSWNLTDFPEGSFFLKDEITGMLVNVNMKTQSSYTLSNSVITSLKIEFSWGISRDVIVVRDWNIISVPLLAADMRVCTLFPDVANCQAFAFNNGYIPTTTLANGKGYWGKFTIAKSYTISGSVVTSKHIPVVAGWNIIGPFEKDIQVSAITTNPSNIIASPFFGYNNGYTQTTALTVGKGYWVKISGAGEIIIPATTLAAKETPEHNPAVQDSWPVLVIEDSQGNTSNLYLAPPTESVDDFELPPLPPSGIFDVRFNNDRYVESLEGGQREIRISSASYPIRVTAQNLGDRILRIKDAVGGNIVYATLTMGQEILVTTELESILLESGALPNRYELCQNHPNPFNPTTLIKFALPEKAHVKITVFNALGEKVTELVNREFLPGYHQVELNVQSYASGVYFYVMESAHFRGLKKMLVVK